MSPRVCIIVGTLLAGLAVAAGTFGAHGLPDVLQDWHGLSAESKPAELAKAQANFETAARYQMYHAFALLCVGLLAERRPAISLRVAGAAFTFGTLVFSGFLYALVLTQQKWLGAIVPIGGTAFLIGWGTMLCAALHRPDSGASPSNG
jgi:uncharacterized membrane protein YgdD (TMEM256/DUF423 family)